MTIAGTWDVTIKTPIGSLAVMYTFTETVGAQSVSATFKDDTVPLRDLAVDGDHMSGHSRAGRLPRSAVKGVRRRGTIS